MTHTHTRKPSLLRAVKQWLAPETGRKGKKAPHYATSYTAGNYYSWYHQPGKPVWMPREYGKFADEAYTKNVIAHRCISLLAQGVGSVPLTLHRHIAGVKERITSHPLLTLLNHPNPRCSGTEFMEGLVTYRMISGNAYLQAVGPKDRPAQELYLLRPDRVTIIAGHGMMPQGYRYTVGDRFRDFPVDRLTGRSEILHIRHFHPLNDWYGLSPIEAAAYSIDLHNEASKWNQSLLQNGARPSGALVAKMGDQFDGMLSEEQFTRLKQEVNEQYTSARNAGRPLLLEGGLEWKEMSLSPKDMDFIECKYSSAREIALAFGVPPQLLGIPGDNTYSNLEEARLALWEQNILPLLDQITESLTHWLAPSFGEGLEISYDEEAISALSLRREKVWNRVQQADFLTLNEKRAAVGLSPLEGGERV